MKRNVFKNTIYAFFLQFSQLIFPVLTTPAISKALGAEQIGIVNYTSAIVAWFALVAAFGTATYGLRETARVRDDPIKLGKLFSELMAVKFLCSIISIALYLPVLIIVGNLKNQIPLMLVQGTSLILNIFSVDWYFQGSEDYRYITVRTLASRIISLLAILLFVRQKSDYILYAGISIFALSFNNIINYVYIAKRVNISFRRLDLKKHRKKLKVFFVSTVVISVYGLLDQVILGLIGSSIDVAFFNRAKMILSVGMGLTMTLCNVFTARMTNYHLTDKFKYDQLIYVTRDIIYIFSVPIFFGLYSLARPIMYLLGGVEFTRATAALQILSPLAVIVPSGTWNYSQQMLPRGKEKVALFMQLSAAVISISLNIILVPKIGFLGTAIAYLIAETSGATMGSIYTTKIGGIARVDRAIFKPLISGLIMWISIIILKQKLIVNTWLGLLSLIIIAAIVYLFALIVFREKTIISIIRILIKNTAIAKNGK